MSPDIEYGAAGFNITSYEDDPLYQIDEANQRITFQLKRDSYTPVAVLKAFMKIGLTLLPDEEVGNFPHLMSWVRSTDHSRRFADQCPIIRTFQPGPMPNDYLSCGEKLTSRTIPTCSWYWPTGTRYSKCSYRRKNTTSP
ncbi:hypothetical protein [Castellaniella defragrans]|uniref:Uncharacterized protein n=1 Tax=Castellaniella defragrans TaxID=75697 RepID=A0A7W9TT03_CASDE|nr:hypothetical protein [Castellaniella defragrans]MBB6084962.1 hypothetical protein [Castellaniella defragrans]